ncbi:MAG: DUF302 domain-containing protein [Bryobacterales bacterium]|nr:DUF302 domain-containing protein [Bryobacterales bacterium]
MIFQLRSARTIAEIDEALRQSATKHQFGVIAVHDLQQTMRNKGVDLATPCLVYEVCNPHKAKQVLESDGALSAALPCRISVYEAADGIHLATILPTALMKLFDSSALESVAREVEDVVVAMMRDAS